MSSEPKRWWGCPDLNRGHERPRLIAWTKLADSPFHGIFGFTRLRGHRIVFLAL
jgi:hypothetical protein